MTSDDQRQLPQWAAFYQQHAVEFMPWFNPELDADLKAALDDLGLRSGSALDVGTGPGTQAVHLAALGFDVTATDIAAAAISKAQARAGEPGRAIDWQVDDILATQLDRQFDLIFDRGCFHVFAPDQRAAYLRSIDTLLKPGGYLFLKCMSHLQPGDQGPYRFTPEQIREIFGSHLTILTISETVYQGTLDPNPHALFCVMRRES